MLLLLAVFAGAPLASRLLGHGPNDPYPYAVSTDLRPVGPWTWVPDLHAADVSGETNELDPPPRGTPETLLVFGADSELGRDELLRLLYGGQVSLEVAIGAALLASLVGALLGALAGFVGGWVDWAVSRLTDLVMAFPVLLLLIMIGSTVGLGTDDVTLGFLNRGVVSLILLIAAFTWFYPARVVRTHVRGLRGREFVEAAQMTGARTGRILRTHLLPHVAPQLVVYATLAVATNILLEAGVTFLGAGIKIPTSSWGTMLAATWGTALNPRVYDPATFQAWLTILPSAAVFLCVLAFNQVGEGLREALDPRAVG